MFVARDQHGVTALHYFINDDVCIVSSSIKPLLNFEIIPKSIDLNKIIRLAGSLPIENFEETYFTNIKLLNASYKMSVSSHTITKERYWYPEKIPINYDIAQQEAIEKLYSLFEEAISCRLHGNNIASELSGGLDSGSIVSITSPLLELDHKVLHTFSHVSENDSFTNSLENNESANERPYIEETIKNLHNVIPNYLYSKDIGILESMELLIDIVDEPIPAAINSYWMIDIMNSAKEKRCDVVLFGKQGNGTISFSTNIQALSIFDFYKQRGLLRTLKTKILKPYYEKINTKLLKVDKKKWKEYCYLNDELVVKHSLSETLLESNNNIVNFGSYKTNREYLLRTLKIANNHSLINDAKISEYYEIERRDPTGDIRIIEFLFSLPSHLFFGPKGEKKYLLKKMMEGKLSDKVFKPKRKGLTRSR